MSWWLKGQKGCSLATDQAWLSQFKGTVNSPEGRGNTGALGHKFSRFQMSPYHNNEEISPSHSQSENKHSENSKDRLGPMAARYWPVSGAIATALKFVSKSRGELNHLNLKILPFLFFSTYC